jgi:hypothetical protein
MDLILKTQLDGGGEKVAVLSESLCLHPFAKKEIEMLREPTTVYFGKESSGAKKIN